MLPLTPETLWKIHSAALGGKSAITGAALPDVLSACPPAVQGSHYAMAVGAAMIHGAELPAIPPGLSDGEAHRIRRLVGPIAAELATKASAGT